MLKYKLKTNVRFYQRRGEWVCAAKAGQGGKPGAVCLGKEVIDPGQKEAARAFAHMNNLNFISY